MNHQFKYRKHIKHMRNLLSVLLFLVTLFFCIFAWLTSLSEFYIFAIIFAVETIVIWKFLGRLTSTTISLGEESIVYTVGNRETVVPYEQITAIQIRSIRYVGGLFKIKSPRKTIKLAITIEDLHRLIQLLKLELDSRGMASIYKPKKLFQFLKTSAFADESWARIYRIWWKLILFTIVTAVAGIANSILSDISGGVTVFFATLFPTIVYVITEFIFKLRISKLANSEEFSVPEPDIVYERKIYKKSMVWGSMVFLIWMLLLFISYQV